MSNLHSLNCYFVAWSVKGIVSYIHHQPLSKDQTYYQINEEDLYDISSDIVIAIGPWENELGEV